MEPHQDFSSYFGQRTVRGCMKQTYYCHLALWADAAVERLFNWAAYEFSWLLCKCFSFMLCGDACPKGQFWWLCYIFHVFIPTQGNSTNEVMQGALASRGECKYLISDFFLYVFTSYCKNYHLGCNLARPTGSRPTASLSTGRGKQKLMNSPKAEVADKCTLHSTVKK